MKNGKKISEEKIQSLRKQLKSLPKKDNSKTLREWIEIFHEDFREAFNRGYSYEEVSEIFISKGIPVRPSTLKTYLKKTLTEESREEVEIERLAE